MKYDEPVSVINRTLDGLLMTASDTGRAGADLRRACGRLKVTAEIHIANNTIAEPLGECFDLARIAGATWHEIEYIRRVLVAEEPVSLIAVLVTQACILFCLGNQAQIIAATIYKSRQDVEAVQLQMREAFALAAEDAANDMQGSTFLAITALSGAVVFYLYDRARPLRLYDNAARADELRDENKVVHPAFMRRKGQALNA
jgi:hypothetical protein